MRATQSWKMLIVCKRKEHCVLKHSTDQLWRRLQQGRQLTSLAKAENVLNSKIVYVMEGGNKTSDGQ